VIGVALAAVLLLPALIWLLRSSGDPAAKPKVAVKLSPAQQRHAELLEARKNLERQIEILRTPVGMRPVPDSRAEMEELKAVLAAINRELEADAVPGVKD